MFSGMIVGATISVGLTGTGLHFLWLGAALGAAGGGGGGGGAAA